jgi:ribosome-associated protein
LTPLELAREAARAADDKKATDIRIMDMRDVLGITDYFVLVSGRNERQVRRIQEAVEEKLSALSVKPARREGQRFGRWILLDYLDFVVHVFLDAERSFYDLERLWKDVAVLEWREGASPESDDASSHRATEERPDDSS